MSNSSSGITSLFGRILLSSMFLWSGLGKVMAFSSMTGYVAAKGLPLPALATGAAAVVEILGGLAVLAGFQARIAAWVLFLYLIPVSLIFHNFWAAQGAEQINTQIHFLKNVMTMGGLLLLAANGAGGYSADAHRALKA